MLGVRSIDTGRLLLSPVSWGDIADLERLKGDPLVYAQMLGGVCDRGRVAAELAADLSFWARTGVGMWIVRTRSDGVAIGLTGLHERSDGRGIALRFAFTPASRGHGLAREAAGAALRFGHERGRLERVIAVARESNISSRTLLGAIGMREADMFLRGSERMLIYESIVRPRPEIAERGRPV